MNVLNQISNASNRARINDDLLRSVSFVTGAAGVVYGIVCIFLGWLPLSVISFGYVVFALTNYYVYKSQQRDLDWHLYFALLVGSHLPFIFQYVAGGYHISGLTMIWSAVPLLLSIIFFGGRIAAYSSVYITLLFAVSVTLDPALRFNGEPLVDPSYSPFLLTLNLSFVTASLSIILYRYLTERTTSVEELVAIREDLSARNRELEHSLEYARRIQTALTAKLSNVRFVIDEQFQYIYQKEKVGGDMIWVGHEGQHVLIAVIDCTGHGVPGSMLTLLANDIMNETVHFMGITDPATIIERLMVQMDERLEKGNGLWSDSADIGLIGFDKESGDIVFSGAGIDLIQCNKTTGVELIKGQGTVLQPDDLSIRHQKNVRIEADTSGTRFYMCSDGLTDLFGGPDHSRYGRERLLDLITRIQDMPFDLQRRMAVNDVVTWHGEDRGLTDDITLIGFNVSARFLAISKEKRSQRSA